MAAPADEPRHAGGLTDSAHDPGFRCPEGLVVRSWGEELSVVYVESTATTSLVTQRAGQALARLAAGDGAADVAAAPALSPDELQALVSAGLLIHHS